MIYVTEDREVECELLRVRSKLITLGRGREKGCNGGGIYVSVSAEWGNLGTRYSVPAPIYPTPNTVNI